MCNYLQTENLLHYRLLLLAGRNKIKQNYDVSVSFKMNPVIKKNVIPGALNY